MLKINNTLLFILASIILAIGVSLVIISSGHNKDPSYITGMVLISASVTVFLIVIESIVRERARTQAFKYLIASNWRSHSYAEDDPVQGVYGHALDSHNEDIHCKITKGKDSDLEIVVSDRNDKWVWRGLITMTSPHTGLISYYHTKDSYVEGRGVNNTGQKRLVAFEHTDDAGVKTIRVYIEQADRNPHSGREVFIREV